MCLFNRLVDESERPVAPRRVRASVKGGGKVRLIPSILSPSLLIVSASHPVIANRFGERTGNRRGQRSPPLQVPLVALENSSSSTRNFQESDLPGSSRKNQPPTWSRLQTPTNSHRLLLPPVLEPICPLEASASPIRSTLTVYLAPTPWCLMTVKASRTSSGGTNALLRLSLRPAIPCNAACTTKSGSIA